MACPSFFTVKLCFPLIVCWCWFQHSPRKIYSCLIVSYVSRSTTICLRRHIVSCWCPVLLLAVRTLGCLYSLLSRSPFFSLFLSAPDGSSLRFPPLLDSPCRCTTLGLGTGLILLRVSLLDIIRLVLGTMYHVIRLHIAPAFLLQYLESLDLVLVASHHGCPQCHP